MPLSAADTCNLLQAPSAGGGGFTALVPLPNLVGAATGVQARSAFSAQASPAAVMLLPKPAAVLLLTPVTFCRGRVLAVGASLPLCHCPTWSEPRQDFRQAKHFALLLTL